MTDRLQCPQCEGTGKQAIGPIRLACPFCHGLGYVGDDNEPAGEIAAPAAHRPVWEDPAVRTLTTVCRYCLGTGKIVNLGGTGEPTGKLIELPCPACGGAEQTAESDS